MLRPQFKIRTMLLSMFLFALAFGLFRFRVAFAPASYGFTSSTVELVWWHIVWGLLGAAVGVLFNKWRGGAAIGALAGFIVLTACAYLFFYI